MAININQPSFRFDTRKGSFRDQMSGTVPTNTNAVTIEKTDKGRAARFASTSKLDGFGAVTGIKTIEIWLHKRSDVKLIQDDGSDIIEISGGNVTGTGLTECYVNNVDTNAVGLHYNHIIAEFSGGIDISTDLEISTGAFAEIPVIRTWSNIGSTTNRASLYNEFQKSTSSIYNELYMKYDTEVDGQIIFNENMLNQNADGKVYTAGMIMPNGWKVESGSYKVVEDTNGKKSFECVTAGIMSIPNKQAYGTYEFSVYKGADGNLVQIHFLADNGTYPDNMYRLMIFNNESIYFSKKIGGGGFVTIFITATSYILNNTLYDFKVTRSLTGEFTFYLKSPTDTNFPNNKWTLIDVSGGSGSNPATDNTYTTSNYIVADLDDGDKIRDITITRGVTT